jgi:hypothetical protein
MKKIFQMMRLLELFSKYIFLLVSDAIGMTTKNPKLSYFNAEKDIARGIMCSDNINSKFNLVETEMNSFAASCETSITNTKAL